MAVEQRIIGGGLLVVGVAVVLILIFFFSEGGMSAEAAHEQLAEEIFPAYLVAEESGDYLEMQAQAKLAEEVVASGGRVGVTKHLWGDATTGTRKGAKRLHRMVKDGVFKKNAEGLFAFDRGWYQASTHRALEDLADAVEGLKALRTIRGTAADARRAIDDARAGAGSDDALPYPAAVELRDEDIPVANPNPIYDNDRELYRVFGLKGPDLEAALATKSPGGGAVSPRARWNRDVAPGTLSEDVDGIPEVASGLSGLANRIELRAREAGKDTAARAAVAKLMKRACDLMAMELAPEHRAAFEENRVAFEKGESVAKVLRREVAMLEPYAPSIRALGAAFGKKFAD